LSLVTKNARPLLSSTAWSTRIAADEARRLAGGELRGGGCR
jgi:hypothetical protein